jgi:putative addiction module component (TIGR02574 family)
MENVSISDVFQLPIEERIRLAQAIWESVASSPDQVPLTSAQVRELDRCYDEYLNDPDEGSSWTDVKARLLADE